MARRPLYFIPLFVLLCFTSNELFAQPTWTLDPFGNEKKPEKYEEKILGSEKTATKKFTVTRRFIQNNVSHYNFYFNANSKLNTVLERAKIAQQDDFSKLLSFYPYSLENTALQKTELDSVIYKCTAGILLHDLRSDWVDNMYLLIGKAYFLRKEFDSAAIAFQFINYNLFPRKKNEDDGRLIGTNNSAQYNVLSIANKEKRNIVQKAFTLPPSRNDALVWLTHTLIDQKQYGDAAGLINILQNDPNLPKRLQNDLEEVTAYWFFKQNNFDSAAVHLEKGITTADTKMDKSRWEFLLGQLYELTGDFDKASTYYGKAAKHTVNPVMDIYARLNDAKMFRNTGYEKELQKSIANLLKMAKKDKFEAYRDIIYYSTGQLSLQKPDTLNGVKYYSKSIYYNEANPLFKNKAYLQLGNLSYNDRKYRLASNYYDSLALPDSAMGNEVAGIEDRRIYLKNAVTQMDIIEREDSLQLIAAMLPAERDAYIKKLAKRYRKLSGQKEEDNFSGNTIITFDKNNQPKDLFAAPTKGEWYFYNSSLKSKGFGEFRSKWGKRENVDNWRRRAAMDAALANGLNGNIDIDAPNPDSLKGNFTGDSKPLEYSYDGLMANVPITDEQKDSSNSSIATAYVKLAKLFQFELEDYNEAIRTYDEYLTRFPDRLLDGEIYLGLYYCYSKIGNESKAAYYKNLLSSKYAGSLSAKKVNNPSEAQPDKKNPVVTQRYERIYNMFIEGDFVNAIAEKKNADSLYGKNYWSPQLLYIESINYIKERNDSQAILVLRDIISLYPESPLKPKAITMIDVLSRRSEIETYLNNLQITRAPEEDRVVVIDEKGVEVVKEEVKIVEPKKIESMVKPLTRPDSIIQTPASMISGVFTWQADKPHYVIMMLNKVDPVYINEAKNAFARYNNENFRGQKIVINKDVLDGERALLVFTVFSDAPEAVSYFDKIKKAAPAEVSWLQPNKYSFLVISETNLQLLKTNKEIDTYKVLLNNQYPGKF